MRVPTKDMFRYQPLRLSFSYLLVCLNGPTTTITRKALSFVSRELTLVGCLGCGSLRCCRNAVPVSDARVVIYQTCCVPIDRLMEKIYGLYLTPKTWETHAGPTIARFRANRDSQRLSREDPPRNFYLNSPSLRNNPTAKHHNRVSFLFFRLFRDSCESLPYPNNNQEIDTAPQTCLRLGQAT